MGKKEKISQLVKIGITGLFLIGMSGCSESEALSDGTYTLQVDSISEDTIKGTIGEISSAQPPSDMNGEPPEAPDGETPPDKPSTENTTENEAASENLSNTESNEKESGEDDTTPPEMPEGEAPPNGGGGMGGGGFTASEETMEFTLSDTAEITVEFMQGSQAGTMDDISEGSVLEVTVSDGEASEVIVKNLNSAGGFGGSDTVTNGTSANTIDSDDERSGEEYVSTGDDENALRVEGATVTLDGITVNKSEGATSNTEDGDFYGQNAAFLALDEANVTITDSEFSSSAQNGNAVFSYGEGTTVTISDSTITTTEDNSGGIQTTGGGTMKATNLTIETSGDSSAAIRSDRGGGTVTVDGGTYTTNGKGSPSIYSTADITVSDAELTANASEGVAIEGKNSVTLKDCTMKGNMTERTANSGENLQTILIYQSMSGDSEIGTSSFTAEGGEITSLVGDMFYVTNTACTIDLKEVTFNNSNDIFLRIAGNDGENGWGTVGSNGGEVDFSGENQEIEGEIIVDEISTLDFALTDGSEFTGKINTEGNASEVNVTLSSDSAWVLTGDSYITSFEGDSSSIDTNGFTLYVDGKEME